ncbi:hypothetical protein [Pandoraea pnomenusa]|uniref:hypothetical protein n=1 Tax=Pandoraea pnomenusa TaxID=93220 RepID=UPI003340957B
MGDVCDIGDMGDARDRRNVDGASYTTAPTSSSHGRRRRIPALLRTALHIAIPSTYGVFKTREKPAHLTCPKPDYKVLQDPSIQTAQLASNPCRSASLNRVFDRRTAICGFVRGFDESTDPISSNP